MKIYNYMRYIITYLYGSKASSITAKYHVRHLGHTILLITQWKQLIADLIWQPKASSMRAIGKLVRICYP